VNKIFGTCWKRYGECFDAGRSVTTDKIASFWSLVQTAVSRQICNSTGDKFMKTSTTERAMPLSIVVEALCARIQPTASGSSSPESETMAWIVPYRIEVVRSNCFQPFERTDRRRLTIRESHPQLRSGGRGGTAMLPYTLQYF
jgi:hypothetical protein